jgi:hypothetical protein
MLYLWFDETKISDSMWLFYPLSFSPRGERFCSFPPGGRLGWGFKRKKENKIP